MKSMTKKNPVRPCKNRSSRQSFNRKNHSKKKQTPSSLLSGKFGSSEAMHQIRSLLQTDLQDLFTGNAGRSVLIQSDELDRFLTISGKGLSLELCIRSSFQDAPRILALLETGISFSEILSRSKKTKTLALLCEMLDFGEAVRLYRLLQKTNAKLKEKLLQYCMYPLFLLFGATLLTLFFSESILPAMQQYTDSAANGSIQLLLGLFACLWILAAVYGFGFLLSTSRFGTDLFVQRFSLFRKIRSIQLSSLLGCFLKTRKSTESILLLISQLDFFPMAARSANHWLKQLRKGIEFKQIVLQDRQFDPLFIRFMLTGMQGDHLQVLLETYTDAGLQSLETELKKISAILQAFAYGSIGFLALSVYQILLAPMQMLETF